MANDPLIVSLCNAGGADLHVWVEPWCDEVVLASRSELALHVESGDAVDWEPQFEVTQEGLTVWGAGNTSIRLLVDGVEQDTGSASLMAPDFGAMGSRGFVEVVFGNFPEARPGGKRAPEKKGWFRRLFESK
jgi:hypothetical protein